MDIDDYLYSFLNELSKKIHFVILDLIKVKKYNLRRWECVYI